VPLYEYACRACGGRFEDLVSRWDSPAPVCPACGAPEARRLLSTFAVASHDASAAGPCGSDPCACRPRLED
jgi:putative FmdB family regulatory protein